MATRDDVYTALRNADAAGDTASVQKLAAYLKTMPADGAPSVHDQIAARIAADPISQGAVDPAGDMSTWERLRAGVGQGMTNITRGVGQLAGKALPDSWDNAIGLPTQSDIDDAKRRDASLLSKTSGKVGSVVGNVAAALPTLFIPGVNGYTGAAAVGAATGALQPVASDEGDLARLKNTAVGTVAAPLGVLGGRVVGGIYQAGKALIQPFTQAGREQIAGNVLTRFADNPNLIGSATSKPTATGALPTLAEQTGDAGIARLQDSLATLDPQIGNQIGGRLAANNAARVAKLKDLAGEDGARDFAVANRAGTAGPMYDQAFAVAPDAAALTAEQSRTLGTLMKSPAIQSAMKDAQAIARNNGTNVGPSNATGSVEGLHNMKMAMDDAIATAKASGQTALADSIKTAQGKLVSFIEDVSPEYANARQVYATMSKPINSMDVAAQVARKGLSAGSTLPAPGAQAGTQTINRANLLRAMQDEPTLIRQATGRSGVGSSLSDVMEPADESMLRSIASEADRAGAVAAAGNGTGSATAQRMASQNVINNLIGPLGAPGGASEGWMGKLADSVLAKTALGKPLNLIYGGVAEPKIQDLLAKAVLDPDTARSVLNAAFKANVKLPPQLATQLSLTAARQLATDAAVSKANR